MRKLSDNYKVGNTKAQHYPEQARVERDHLVHRELERTNLHVADEPLYFTALRLI